MYVCVCVCVCVYVCMFVCVYVCMCLCACVCSYVYMCINVTSQNNAIVATCKTQHRVLLFQI